MSIFRRDDPPAGQQPAHTPNIPTPAPRRPDPAPPSASGNRAPAAAATVTQVASGCRIEGKVSGKSNLRIDGEIVGTVEVDSDVTVASGGVVKGDVSANSVTIGGRIVGNVRGGSKVEILASGRLEGDVKAARVVLAEGAYFKGKVEMTGGQA